MVIVIQSCLLCYIVVDFNNLKYDKMKQKLYAIFL